MVGYHGITGWSGGGRRPLTYSLMPGQMRNTRVNIFQSNYVMPMATCYYADPCQCNNDSGMPKWLQWTMLGGMGTQLLGGIFSGIFGGGGSTEGAGGAKKDADAELDLRQLKTDYKNYTFSRYSDGTVRARDKNGKVIATANSPLELRDALDELANKTEVDTPVVNHELNKANLEIAILKNPTLKGKITYNETKGEFVVGDNSFKDLKDAIAEAKKSNTSEDATPTAVPTVNTSTEITTSTEEPGTYKLQNDDTWYSIVMKYNLPSGTSVSKAIGELERMNGLKLNMTQRASNKIGPQTKAEDGNIKIPKGWKLKTTQTTTGGTLPPNQASPVDTPTATTATSPTDTSQENEVPPNPANPIAPTQDEINNIKVYISKHLSEKINSINDIKFQTAPTSYIVSYTDKNDNAKVKVVKVLNNTNVINEIIKNIK